jgi:hypothetical protein
MVSTPTVRSLISTFVNDNTVGDITAGDMRSVLNAILDAIDTSVPSVLQYGAVANGIANDGGAFTAADAAGPVFCIPPGIYRITSNITLSKVLVFAPGAVLLPSSGVTVTLSGEIVAGMWKIFDNGLGGSFVGPVRNQHVYPDWWGAAPGVASDQSPKIQAAITFAESGGRTVYLRNGLWRCDQTLFIRQPASIVGAPGIAAQSVTSATSALDFSNAATSVSGLVVGRTIDFPLDGITLRNIAIYRGTLAPTGSGCFGLVLRSCAQVECESVSVWNFDRNYTLQGTAAYPCGMSEFRNCRSQYAGTMHWDIWSAIDCVFDRCSVGGGPALTGFHVYPNAGAVTPNALHWTNCVSVLPEAQDGIRILVGFWHSIEDCVFEEMNQTGILVAMPLTDISLISVLVSDCWFNNCGTGFASISDGGNFRLRDNRIEATHATAQFGIRIDNSTAQQFERDILIEGNSVKVAGAATAAIAVNYANGTRILNNRVVGVEAAASVALIGLGASTTGSLVSGNRSQTTFSLSADGISNSGTNNVLVNNTKY